MAGTRPSEFDQDFADLICERLADGESLRAICRDDHMPTKAMVFRWLARNPAFADQYARARETQADSLADDIIDIADNRTIDANDKRVRIDARKWLAGKLRPKRYGDKQSLEHTGPGGGPIQHVDLSHLSDTELERLEGILGPLVGVGEGGEGEEGGGS